MASGLWSADVLSQTRRGLSQRELQETLSREPDCGNRNVGRARGAGEATVACEASGGRVSNTETRSLPTICYGYSCMAHRRKCGPTTPIEVVTVGAWLGRVWSWALVPVKWTSVVTTLA